jgi:hypothetical protein
MDNATAANLNALVSVAQQFLDSTEGGKRLELAVGLLK